MIAAKINNIIADNKIILIGVLFLNKIRSLIFSLFLFAKHFNIHNSMGTSPKANARTIDSCIEKFIGNTGFERITIINKFGIPGNKPKKIILDIDSF
jgi:hypothetical protein